MLYKLQHTCLGYERPKQCSIPSIQSIQPLYSGSCRVVAHGLMFGILGLGFRAEGLRFRIQGLGSIATKTVGGLAAR